MQFNPDEFPMKDSFLGFNAGASFKPISLSRMRVAKLLVNLEVWGLGQIR